MVAAVLRVFRALTRITRVVLTWVVLTPFFFLVCPLARLVLAVRGRDPLRRRFPAPEASCWDARRAAPGRYRRPFA
jgi:hypothetical protein